MTIDGPTVDDFRRLSEAFNAGNRFLVIAAGDMQLVGSRAEASNLVNSNGPSVAFEVRELTSGNYQEAAPAEKESPYRSTGKPY